MKKSVKLISIVVAVLISLATACMLAACGDDGKDPDDKQYTITFVTGDGTAVGPITAHAGDAITPPDDPSLDGHDFIGWFETPEEEAQDGDEPVAIPTVMPSKDMTFYARYRLTQNTDTYRIIYEYNLGNVAHGGTVADTVGTSGEEVTVSDGRRYSPIGYMFVGWTNARNGVVSLSGGKAEGQYNAGDKITLGETNITLYAQWAREYTDARKESDDRIYVYSPLVGKGLGAAILIRSGKDDKLGFVADKDDTASGYTEFTFYFEEADGGDVTGRLYDDFTYAYASGEASQYLYYDHVTQEEGGYILALDEYDFAVLIQIVGSQTVVRASGNYAYDAEYGDYLFAYVMTETQTVGQSYFALDKRTVADTEFDGYFSFQGEESDSYLLYDNGELLSYRLDLNGYGAANLYSYDPVNDSTVLVASGEYRGTDRYEDYYGEWEFTPDAGSDAPSFKFVLNSLATDAVGGYVKVYIEYDSELDKTLSAEVGNGTLQLNGYGVAVYSESGIAYEGNFTVRDTLITFVPYISDGDEMTVGGTMYFNVDWSALTYKVNTDGFLIVEGELTSYRGKSQIVVIPEEVSSVADNAFNYVQTEVSLISVTIPSSVTSIGVRAFQNNYTLRRAIFLSETPIEIDWSSENSPFRWPSGSFIIVVPEGSQDAYKAAWTDCPYAIKGSVEVTILPEFEIEDGVLVRYNKPDDSAAVLDIKIPDEVTEIADDVFMMFDFIRSVDLNNVTRIGDRAFYGCANLETVIFTNVRTIGDGAFLNCVKLSSSGEKDVLELPSIVTIGASAFADCESLRHVKLGVGLTDVGDTAFYECQIYDTDPPLVVELMGATPPVMGGRVTTGNIAFRFKVQSIDVALACFDAPTWNSYCRHLFIESGAEKGKYMCGDRLLELDGRAMLQSTYTMMYVIDGTKITLYEHSSETGTYTTTEGTIENGVINVSLYGTAYEFKLVDGVATYVTADGKYTLKCDPLDMLPENYENYSGVAQVEFNGVTTQMYIVGFETKTIRGFTDADGNEYDVSVSFDGNTLVVVMTPAEVYIRNIAAADGSVINLHYRGNLVYVYGELKINVGTQSSPRYLTWSDGGALALFSEDDGNEFTFSVRYLNTKYTVTVTLNADKTAFTYNYVTE